jgi:hypothetical protein
MFCRVQALKVLGLGTPFIYASATYGLFNYLDRRASGQAKKAISGWLQPKEYDKAGVADAMVEIFDRLYIRPLFGWQAFTRSTLFTICMSAVFFYEFGLLSAGSRSNAILMYFMNGIGQVRASLIIALGVLANVVCDYIALFIIRPFLIFGKRRPMLASLLAPIAGISIVLGAYYSLNKAFLSAILYFFDPKLQKIGIPLEELLAQHAPALQDILREVASISGLYGVLQWVLRPAAFVVHLWLPLLAVQWFAKKGREHPLDAIGTVAAVFVLAATAVIQYRHAIAMAFRPVVV